MSNVESILIVVVLPAPFGPSRPKIVPRGTAKLTSSTAMTRFRGRQGHRPLSYTRPSPRATIAPSSDMAPLILARRPWPSTKALSNQRLALGREPDGRLPIAHR